MKTSITAAPGQDAGKHISDTLRMHAHQPVLFLISGGSALTVLTHIDPEVLGANITIGLVDERFTTDEQGNNFMQLESTDFYKTALEKGVRFIVTKPHSGERHENFALRIGDALESLIETTHTQFTVGLFGIGEDGHTASIFPSTEHEFKQAYNSDRPYVAISRPDIPYPFRISLTPQFIEEKIDEVILYAVGSKKCDNILSYMHTKNFGAHEIPALIPARHIGSTLFTDCAALG